MNVLVAENDKITRDHAVVGLENFDNINVDMAMGKSALDMIRQKDYDFVLIGLNPGDNEGTDLIRDIRRRDKSLDIIAMAGEIIAKNMSREKIHSNIFSFIDKPLDPHAFHQTVNRLKRRILDRK